MQQDASSEGSRYPNQMQLHRHQRARTLQQIRRGDWEVLERYISEGTALPTLRVVHRWNRLHGSESEFSYSSRSERESDLHFAKWVGRNLVVPKESRIMDKTHSTCCYQSTDLLDAVLLRAGRFDKLIYVGPFYLIERLKILELNTRSMPLEQNVKM